MRQVTIYIAKKGELKNSHIKTTRGLTSTDLTVIFNHPYIENLRDKKLREEFIKEMENNRDIKVRFE